MEVSTSIIGQARVTEGLIGESIVEKGGEGGERCKAVTVDLAKLGR